MAITDTREKSRIYRPYTPQVEASRAQYAPTSSHHGNDPWWKLYLEKFEDPVIRFLIIAAVITIIVGAVDGHYAEGIAILIAIFLATTLAFVNDFRAQREFDGLNASGDDARPSSPQRRFYIVVQRKELVVGDIVLIEAGDENSADGWVREAVALQVNEALLTGESLPAAKLPANRE